MNIVFVTTNWSSSNQPSVGLASFTSNMARIFTKNGHRVYVLWVTTKEQQVEPEQGIEVFSVYVPMKEWKRIDRISKIISHCSKWNNDDIRRTIMGVYKGRGVRKALQKIEQTNSIDIMHFCNHVFVDRRLARRMPYVVRLSGFQNIWKGGANTPKGSVLYKDNPVSLPHKLEEYTIRHARYVISPSYLLAGIVKENLKNKATVLESPFVLVKQEWDDSVLVEQNVRGKKYIIHFGILKYTKGTYLVAQLSKDFLSQHKDFCIVLAGRAEDLVDEEGNKIKADEYVKRCAGEFADRVLYTGHLAREKLYPLIQNAELCLLPSRIENLPNACIEGMAMGKIVVATNGASYEQLIEDRVSGFLCERDDPDSFLQGINEAIGLDTEEKEKMCARAREVTKRLEPQKVYQNYLHFYEKVISEW